MNTIKKENIKRFVDGLELDAQRKVFLTMFIEQVSSGFPVATPEDIENKHVLCADGSWVAASADKASLSSFGIVKAVPWDKLDTGATLANVITAINKLYNNLLTSGIAIKGNYGDEENPLG